MKVRTLKRRHDARTLHRWHFLADLRAEMMMDDWPDDWDDDGYDDGLGDRACEHCSGQPCPLEPQALTMATTALQPPRV